MSVRLKKVDDQVIVITGASSGIGLTTARMAARRGARLVLASRNEEALNQLADEIRGAGGQAVPVKADVGNEDDVRAVARAAVERFGGFDTWVNNAAGSVYGQMLDIPTADHRRLFETNFWGTVYGSLEAARHLRQRTGPYAGAIINVGSEVSDRAIPTQGMYSTSKHAVKGFTDALRMELEEAKAPVSVTLVKPAAIDTPFTRHARSYMEEEPALPSPMYAPEVVAEVILHCAETPVRDVYAGGSAKYDAVMGGLAPRFTDWLMEMFFTRQQKSDRPNDHADALYQPGPAPLQERGGNPGRVRESSVYTKASLHPILMWGLLLSAGLAAAAIIGESSSRRRGS